jgi:hypothetical protein
VITQRQSHALFREIAACQRQRDAWTDGAEGTAAAIGRIIEQARIDGVVYALTICGWEPRDIDREVARARAEIAAEADS